QLFFIQSPRCTGPMKRRLNMAFTREFIRKAAKECGLDIPKEFENALVDEHLSARDTYAEAQVKDALEKNKPAEPPKIKDTDEYKAQEGVRGLQGRGQRQGSQSGRSEEHTSELQSRFDLVCRLLLEK